MSATQIERFWSKVSKGEGCWLWTASKSPKGYGQVKINGAPKRAHRFSWELANGPIPAGMFVCHRCDVPACVNPDHLWLGTIADDNRDMIAKGHGSEQQKTHCIRGHEFTPENTRARGHWRLCRACDRIRTAEYRNRKSA